LSKVLKGFSQLLSVLFHPLLIVIYVFLLFLLINPYLFPYRTGREFGTIMLVVFFTTIVIPGISILMMYFVGLISSLQMWDKTERIGPLIVTAICYLWLFLNVRTHDAIPPAFTIFLLGSIIALFIAFFINNFSKISLHAVGLGGMLLAIINILSFDQRAYSIIKIGNDMSLSIHNIFLLSIIVIIIGAVLSSRLYLKAHQLQDVTGGLLVGIVGQLIAINLF